MSRLTQESTVNLGKKQELMSDVLKTVIYLPADKVVSFFNEIGLTIPREIRMHVLREILRERVIVTRKNRLTLADELNYRLSWFAEFTETQLENLLVYYDDPELDLKFLKQFWIDLFSYMMDKGVSPDHLRQLVDESIKHVKKVGLDLPDMRTYNRGIKNLFFDSFDRIDGLTQKKIRTVLYKSSTLTEIRDLGLKYDVRVPKRLKKSELADIIVRELKERGEHSDELEAKVRGMSVLVMQRFAIDHNIKASTELKKEEIIEYILANAKETRETYFVPESDIDYYKDANEDVVETEDLTEPQPEPEVVVAAVVTEDLHEEVVEEIPAEEDVQTEPVVEDDIEVVESDVEEDVEEPATTPVFQTANMDISELLEEVKLLREAVETLIYVAEEDFEEDEEVSVDEETAVDHQPLILNSAEVYGKTKFVKKIVKKDEADEREAFIEGHKSTSGIGTGVEARQTTTPRELQMVSKFFAKLGRVLKKSPKYIIYTLIVLFIVLMFYALFSKALEPTGMLDSVDNALNFNFFGKGFLDYFKDLLGAIGL
ncbi:MAG: hypothetical protein K9K93_04470 [Acholeplasmataceae bacterium]|nr:hypothetical protein [Acholeplasmataceae bacterium]